MAPSPQTPGVVSGRLSPEALAANFADIAPAALPARGPRRRRPLLLLLRRALRRRLPDLHRHPALHPRDRDRHARGGGARRSSSQNILGGMCARVCPTETLCEEACVREAAEGKPVEIGRLQRFATDALMREGPQPFARAAPTGKRVAVVGAGPAGLACAHRLAMLGHDVVALRRPRQARRPQRIRHRRLQDGGRLRPGRGRLAPRHRRHHRRAKARASARDLTLADLLAELRRRLPRHRPRRRARARPTARGGPRRAAGRRVHRRAAPGRGPRHASRSAAGWW